MERLHLYQAVELVSFSLKTDRMTFRVDNGETRQVSLIAFNRERKENNRQLSDGKYGTILSVIGEKAYLELPNEVMGV